jgi:hypothetical protein
MGSWGTSDIMGEYCRSCGHKIEGKIYVSRNGPQCKPCYSASIAMFYKEENDRLRGERATVAVDRAWEENRKRVEY